MHTTQNVAPAAKTIAESNRQDQTLEFLAFTLGEEKYAVATQKVQELRAYETVPLIANAPEMRTVVLLSAPVVIDRELLKATAAREKYDAFLSALEETAANARGRAIRDKISAARLVALAFNDSFVARSASSILPSVMQR